MSDKHYACNNPSICNKNGYQPNELCKKYNCKFLILQDEKENLTDWEIYQQNKKHRKLQA